MPLFLIFVLNFDAIVYVHEFGAVDQNEKNKKIIYSLLRIYGI